MQHAEFLSVLLVLGLIALAFFIYWYPTLLAKRRHHNNFGSIKLVNLFFGWTFIGWVVALIWAASDNVAAPS